MHDARVSIFWLLATVVLVESGRRWSRWAFPRDRGSAHLVHVIVFSWAVIVGTALVLELLRILSPWLLLLAAPSGALMVLVTCVAGVGEKTPAVPLRSGRSRTVWRTLGWPSVLWPAAWALLAAILLGRSLLCAATAFPTDWDSLAYHIPLVDHWIREGTLYVPASAFWYCPGNAELLGYWLVGPFSGDFWIGLNNLPALLLLPASAFQLLRSLRVSRTICHLAAITTAATALTWRQAITNENDAAVAALFVASLWYGLRFALHSKRPDGLLCAISLGLLAGTKYLALGYAGVGAVSALLLVSLRRRVRDLVLILMLELAGSVFFGGYWYARNYVATGTPLFPKGFSQSTDLWSQMRPEWKSSTLVGSRRRIVWPMLYTSLAAAGGPIHVVAYALAPGVLLSLLLFSKSPLLTHQSRAIGIWLTAILVLSNVVFAVTPNIVETAPNTLNMLSTRYQSIRLGFAAVTVTLLVFLVALAGFLRDCADFCRPLGSRLIVYGSVGAWFAVLGVQIYRLVSADLMQSLGVIVVSVPLLALISYIALRASRYRALLLGIAGLAAIPLFAWTSHVRGAYWHRNFARHYVDQLDSPVFDALSSESNGKERICVCDDRYYPFLGSRREREVSRPLWIPDAPALLRYLWEYQASHLVARRRSGSRRYVGVPETLNSYSGIFIPIYEDQVFTLVRVDRERLEAAMRVREKADREL